MRRNFLEAELRRTSGPSGRAFFFQTRFRTRYVHINVNGVFSFKSLNVRKLWCFSFKLRFSLRTRFWDVSKYFWNSPCAGRRSGYFNGPSIFGWLKEGKVSSGKKVSKKLLTESGKWLSYRSQFDCSLTLAAWQWTRQAISSSQSAEAMTRWGK